VLLEPGDVIKFLRLPDVVDCEFDSGFMIGKDRVVFPLPPLIITHTVRRPRDVSVHGSRGHGRLSLSANMSWMWLSDSGFTMPLNQTKQLQKAYDMVGVPVAPKLENNVMGFALRGLARHVRSEKNIDVSPGFKKYVLSQLDDLESTKGTAISPSPYIHLYIYIYII
jgi:hypothetical protein